VYKMSEPLECTRNVYLVEEVLNKLSNSDVVEVAVN